MGERRCDKILAGAVLFRLRELGFRAGHHVLKARRLEILTFAPLAPIAPMA